LKLLLVRHTQIPAEIFSFKAKEYQENVLKFIEAEMFTQLIKTSKCLFINPITTTDLN